MIPLDISDARSFFTKTKKRGDDENECQTEEKIKQMVTNADTELEEKNMNMTAQKSNHLSLDEFMNIILYEENLMATHLSD